jgi:Ca2+/H+ antiporter
VPRAILTEDAVHKQRAPDPSEPALLWAVVFAGGLCLAVVGWTDVALLWYPLNLGNVEWEFATVAAHVMGMPLGTLGFAMLAAGALGRGWRGLGVTVASGSGVVAFSLVALAVLFALAVPVALAGTAPEMRTILDKTLLKVTVYLVAYFAFYSWLAFYVWQAVKRTRR